MGPSGVRVLVVRDRQLLLVEHDHPDHGRFWVLPGGGQEPDETLHATARREVREETGLELVRLRRTAVPRSVVSATEKAGGARQPPSSSTSVA